MISSLSIVLVLAVVIVGVGLTASPLWPAQALPLQWQPQIFA
jgi:hypothetical protein